MCLKGCVILLTLSEVLPVCPAGKRPPFYRGQPSSSLLGPVMCKNLIKGPAKSTEVSLEGDFKDSITRKRWLGSPPPPPPPPGSAWVAVPCPPPPPQMGCHTNHALPRKLQRQAKEFIPKCSFFCHNIYFFPLFLLQLSSSDGSGAGTSHASSFSML